MNFMLPIIAAVSFFALAGLEYLICAKAKNPSAQKLMFFVPFLIFVGALVVFGSDANGSFLDMRGMVTAVLTVYGILSLVAIAAGWLIYQLKHVEPEAPEDCPYSQQE